MTHFLQPQQPDRSELSVLPLQRVEVVRTPAFGTNGSQTGAIVEPVTQVVILTESSIEKKLVRTLLADPRVKSVRTQDLKIAYRDQDGAIHHHTVDIVATLHDGTRIGYVVKDESAAIRHGTRNLVEALAAAVPASKIDRLQLVTGRQLPEWGDLNSRQLLNARRDRRTHVDDMLLEMAPELLQPIRIGDLTESLGGGAIAFRPVLRAIAFGTLVYLGVGVIDENGSVKFSGEVKTDLDRPKPVPFETSASIDPPVIHKPKKQKPPAKKRFSHRAH